MGSDILMKILVMGGTGAMGYELVPMLASNESNTVTVTSRSKIQSSAGITYIQGNAKDLNFIQQVVDSNQYDVIVDFMLYTIEEFKERYELLLCSCNQYIFFSSARVYAASEEPIKEDSPRLLDVSTDQEYLSQGEYSLTKAIQEDILRDSSFDNWVIIRPYKTYSNNRLQLGVFELEQWLYRAMAGKTVVVPGNIKDLHTSLTSSKDTARILLHVIGNNTVNGRIIQIANPDKITWREVISIYSHCIEEKYGRKIKVYYADDTEDIELLFNNKYRIKYDGLIDRVFDGSSVNSLVGGAFNWTPVCVGLTECTNQAIKMGYGKLDNYGIEGMFDRLTQEHVGLSDIPGLKNKSKYLIHRNFSEKSIDLVKKIVRREHMK